MLFKQIDWLLIKGYFKSYAICLISLLSLYVVVDLFMHLDDFFHNNSQGLGAVVKRVGLYYAYRVPQLFDQPAAESRKNGEGGSSMPRQDGLSQGAREARRVTPGLAASKKRRRSCSSTSRASRRSRWRHAPACAA